MLHLLFEDGNSELKNRFFPLGKNIRKHLQKTLDDYDGDRTVDGYKRLNNLLSMENGIAYNEMKRIKNFFDNYRGSVNTPEYILNGGDKMRLWVNDTLNTATKQVKDFKDAKLAVGMRTVKPHDKDRQIKTTKPTVAKFQTRNAAKDIDSNNSIKYESILRENTDEDHEFYDYLSDYDCHYVLTQFLADPHGKQKWGVLIDPNMYAKALGEYTRYGQLLRFPTDKIYQWMGILMKNSAILYANGQLAGHTTYYPYDEVGYALEDYFGDRYVGMDSDGNITVINDDGKEETKEAQSLLEEMGIYEWMSMPDGESCPWTDYGIKPIFNLISEYNHNKTPEETLVIINKILDVYHQNGDLSCIFIKGGSKALTNITFRADESKKRIVIISEKQMRMLNEGEIYRTYGIGKFDLSKLKPIKNILDRNKPSGGLWASPTGENANTWRHWAEKEHFAIYEDDDYFDFELAENARVLKIADLSVCNNIPMQWDNPDYQSDRAWRYIMWKKDVYDDSNHHSDWLPDFEKLAETYDAIDFTCNHETYNALHGWDCDSLLVMNPDVIKIVKDSPNIEGKVKYLDY